MKTQTIRLLDVFFVGPVMVAGGWKLREEHPVLGNILVSLGVLTVLYNGRNYFRVGRHSRRLVP